ncbi:hypothetical protein Dda_6250 [Drechslerella dactyloides]|uniref:Uncharacterized protein n=1 Tax=Drechslerella dactyloides TaxID=74499 RepID=A0AAD6IXG6_DREDA|nr:hypothetical protein Dda_6250 [Drechslerella dactyloides]
MHLPQALTAAVLIFIAPRAAAQRTVFVTSTTTVTELVVCGTTEYTTTTLDYCPCSSIFSTPTNNNPGQICTTTTISPPAPSATGFTIQLTVPMSAGDQVITLSRVGNTVGIGGQILTFNLSDTGVMRDTLTGDTVYVILPRGAIRKRFEGSVDLLIGPVPPPAATTMTWVRTSDGNLIFVAGQNSANPITLGFGVYLADDGSIDTTVPIQMYDVSAGIPSGIDDGSARQSFVTPTRSGTNTGTGTGSSQATTRSSTSRRSTRSSASSESSESSSISTRTFTVRQYGSTTFTSSSTLAAGIVYVIIQELQDTVTVTFYGPGGTTTTQQFDQYDPTVTVFDIISQVITTTTIFGSFGYTSTPTIGSIFPTITAIAQLSQVTVSNITYGSEFSTLSQQTNSSDPTVTIFVQLTPTTTITTTTYIWNQFPISTTTIFGTEPTATVLVVSNQYREYTTNTNTFDTTITIGPDNPTATISFAINPTSTFTIQPAILEWNFTTTSTETVDQPPTYTRTIRLHIPYPPPSAIRFAPTDAAAGNPQYFAAATTSVLNQYNAWYGFTADTSFARFIQINNNLILATDPDTGDRLPYPAYPWGFFPLSPLGSPIYWSLFPVDYTENPSAESGGIPWNLVPGTDFLMLNVAFNESLQSTSAALWYDGGAPGPYTPYFYSTADAAAQGGARTYKTIDMAMMSLTASAPTAR